VADTHDFGRPDQTCTWNLRARDPDAMRQQLRVTGATVLHEKARR
jgi:hypothetical protein